MAIRWSNTRQNDERTLIQHRGKQKARKMLIPPNLFPKKISNYSISSTRSSPSRCIPTFTWIFFTVPETGELTKVSIFIALRTHKGWPFSIACPSLTLISITFPGIGAPICPFTSLRALGWKCISCEEIETNILKHEQLYWSYPLTTLQGNILKATKYPDDGSRFPIQTAIPWSYITHTVCTHFPTSSPITWTGLGGSPCFSITQPLCPFLSSIMIASVASQRNWRCCPFLNHQTCIFPQTETCNIIMWLHAPNPTT